MDDESEEETDDAFSRISYKKRIACTNHVPNKNLKYGIKHTENAFSFMNEANDKIKPLKKRGGARPRPAGEGLTLFQILNKFA